MKDWHDLKAMPEYRLTIYVKEDTVVDNVKKILRYKRKAEKIYKEVKIIIL
jgi:hypothetical protein